MMFSALFQTMNVKFNNFVWTVIAATWQHSSSFTFIAKEHVGELDTDLKDKIMWTNPLNIIMN